MGLRIQNNIEAFNAQRSLTFNSSNVAKSMQRLSSGFRINSAADDAAGLAVSERMRAQIRGLEVAQRNVQDGVSFVQAADGAMAQVHSILQRARELALQYNGSGGASGNFAITTEAAQLSAEVSRLITSANYNGIQLLTGSAVPSLTLQIGANGGESLGVTLANVLTSIGTALSQLSTGTANITGFDTAINNMSGNRARLGAIQNRLEYTGESLGIFQENLMSAESRIRDTDMASEMSKLTKYQILQESSMAMLAQANQGGASILSLLR